VDAIFDRNGVLSGVVLLALLLPLPLSSCKKSERLPSRTEELESFDAAQRAGATEEPGAPAAPSPQLEAPGRPAPERVSFKTKDGVTIVGDWFPPAQEDPEPAVLLVHGADGSRLDWQPFLARLLPTPTARPAVLAIDLRGHGESVAGPRGKLDARSLQEPPRGDVDSWLGVIADVTAALTWLQARPEVGARVVVAGVDIGAVAAVRAAADLSSVPGARLAVVGLLGLSPAELHGVAFGPQAFPVLAAKGVRAFAVAAEDGPAEPPQGVRAIESGLGVSRVEADVFAAGGHGVALLERRPDVLARALGFLRRALAGTAEFDVPVEGGIDLRASADLSLDPGGPAVIVVHDLGSDRTALRKLRLELSQRLPFDLVFYDQRGHGASAVAVGAGDAGDAAAVPFDESVPADDVRSWWVLVRDLETVVRRVVAGEGGTGGAFPALRRTTYALVGVGLGATVAATAAGQLADDGELPPLAALALISPIANAHGLSIWPALGDKLLPRGVGVFAAAGSRAAMSLEDAVEGFGSEAKTVQTIGTMFRGAAVTRIYTTEAHGDVLINQHVDLAPTLADFLYARLVEPPVAVDVGGAQQGGAAEGPAVPAGGADVGVADVDAGAAPVDVGSGGTAGPVPRSTQVRPPGLGPGGERPLGMRRRGLRP
jgi:pimeloyl-ACP methyl ester carboxylesterase